MIEAVPHESETIASNTGPAPDLYGPIRELLRAGKNDEAIVRFCAIVVIRPDDLVAKELLFDAFFQKRDWLPALALIEQLARSQPDMRACRKRLIIDALEHEALRRGDRARFAIHRALRRGPHHARRAQGRAFLYRQDRSGDPLRATRHRTARRPGLPPSASR